MAELAVSIEYSEDFKVWVRHYEKVILVLFAWEVELGVERFITASFLALEFYIFIIEQLCVVVLVRKVLQKGSLGVSWVILGPGILRLQDGLIIEEQGFILYYYR